MRKIVAGILLLVLLAACSPQPTVRPVDTDMTASAPLPGLIGNCHAMLNLSNPYVTWAYPAGAGFLWSDVEPARGTYNWDALDAAVAQANAAGKQVWLQVQSNNPGVAGLVPGWALDLGLLQLPDCPATTPNCSNYNASKALGWDDLYFELWEELIAAAAARYDGHVEAWLAQLGGNYGEGSQTVKACHGQAGADVHDVNSIYIQRMAQVTGDSPEVLTQPYTDPAGNSYVAKFDYWYVETAKRIIDLYMRHFTRTAVVIQLGSGVSCQGSVPEAIAAYAVERYGPRVVLKQNGWGNNVSAPYYYSYNRLFAQYAGVVRTVFEVGAPGNWCDGWDASGAPINAGYGCSLHNAALAHNGAQLRDALKAGVSAVCFQSQFFSQPTRYPLGTPWAELQAGLLANYQAVNGIVLPTSTPQPSATPQPTPTRTPAPTLTATPAPTPEPTAAPTPLVVTIHVQGATITIIVIPD